MIFIDADEIRLYAHGNGFTDAELDRLQEYDHALDQPQFAIPNQDETAETDENAVEGYCGKGEGSELMRLMRHDETFDWLYYKYSPEAACGAGNAGISKAEF